MKEILWLVKNGVPYNEVFNLDDTVIVAWSILFSEMEGNKFNWSTMKFEEKK